MIKQILFKIAYSMCFLIIIHQSKLQACTGTKIAITNFVFTAITSSEYAYSYTIKNVSGVDIPLNKIVIQNYVSTDNAVGNDPAGGGTYIDNLSSKVIAPGESYTGTYYVSPFPENPISTYPYVITKFFLSTETGCDITDDAHYIGLVELPTPTSLQAKQYTDATVIWNAESKSFTVKDWSGSTSALSYKIFSVSGMYIVSGQTTQNLSTPLSNLHEGMYILYLSDGNHVHSEKIFF